MLNNKGFAITTILYGIMILFIMLLLAMLGILNNYKNNLSKIIDGSRNIIKEIDDDTNIVEITGKVCEAEATEIEKYTCIQDATPKYTCDREAIITKYRCAKDATPSYSGTCTCYRFESGVGEPKSFSNTSTNDCGKLAPSSDWTCRGTLNNVSYSCDSSAATLSGAKCYLYNQSTCSSGWTKTATAWSCTSYSGSTQNGSTCYKYNQTTCDSGWTKTLNEYTCPNGGSLYNTNKCRKTNQISCSSGWTKTPGTSTYNCLNSTINNKTNMCEVTVNSDEECPQGFTEK